MYLPEHANPDVSTEGDPPISVFAFLCTVSTEGDPQHGLVFPRSNPTWVSSTNAPAGSDRGTFACTVQLACLREQPGF